MPAVAPPRVLIVSTSLNPASRSRALASYALDVLRETAPDVPASLLDVRDLGSLPLAGSPEAGDTAAHDGLNALRASLRNATHLLLAVPIYNFAASASAKNLLELMVAGEEELSGKTVGFLCAAGGPRSYMSVLSLANSLMLDFRCWIVPRFVYATGGDFADGRLVSSEVQARIAQLTSEMFERTVAPATW